MRSSRPSCVEHPRVAFRVGVTGAVSFDPSQVNQVRTHVAAVLQQVHDEVRRCAKADTTQRVYDPDKPILLRLISPLAEGADRMVAEEALKCGFQLETPLPFKKKEYKATFNKETPEHHTASIAEFETLLAAADMRVLALDGDSLDEIDRHRSYEAIGRLVVRNCDLLVAIWDNEKTPRGRGGTTDTVQYALRGGVPVWWIHAAKDVPPKWLEDILDLPRFGVPEAPKGSVHDELQQYIARAILPPDPAESKTEGTWRRVIRFLRWAARIQADPLLGYLGESGKPNRKYWNLHANFIRALREGGGRQHARREARRAGKTTVAAHHVTASPAAAQPSGSPTPSHNRFVRWLGLLGHFLAEPFRRNQPGSASSVAAGLSGVYRDRYRSSYTVVFVCGALALSSAVIGIAFDAAEVVTPYVELLTLGIILGLVITNRLLRWHERYISYRMLGELLRMSLHLHRLGWSLPGSRVNNLAQSTRRNWVAWFFAATVRATPLATGDFSKTMLTEAKTDIIDNLIGGQLHFHDKRRIECDGAAHRLARWGRVLFLLTLVFVLTRVALLLTDAGHEVVPWLSLICALLPAASAAFFGLRAYEELEVLAEQSEQMHEALSRAQARIRQIAVDRPLASQVLGTELFDVAMIMLSDVTGWAQLFRMKVVEA